MEEGGFHCQQLAVVGLGLLGSSMAMALRNHAEVIIGIDLHEDTRAYAQTHRIVDVVTDDLYEGVSDADTVILATPVGIISELLRRRIGSYLRNNTLLIDVGSTKQDICEAMGRLPIGINAVGGHPMAGKEYSGIQSGDANLFVGKPFVLCDTRRTTPATIARALPLVRTIGAIPIQMNAEEHDQIVAAISHLPYLLSTTLVATVAERADENDSYWQLAASGFRDTSRLASSDIKMMSDILGTNTQAVTMVLAMFRMHLARLEAMLLSGDQEKVVELLVPIREARQYWSEEYEH